MATEVDIQAAESARLEELVDRFGTEAEKNWLPVCVALERMGVPLRESGSFQAVLATYSRRAERRAKFGLPPALCGGDPPTLCGCRCLEEALDGESEGKRDVLAEARSRHWSPRTAKVLSFPNDAKSPIVGDFRAHSEPDPKLQPEPTPEPPFRPIKRSPKWFDAPSRFEDMRF